MAKKVIWSQRAQNDRKKILKYWIARNKSNDYSIKLNELFKEAINMLADYPEIGKITDNKGVRMKIVRDYLIIYEYEVKNEQLIILAIWDSRRNPQKLQKLLKK